MLHIFIHIPKTAGTSLWDILKQEYQEDEIIALYDLNPYALDQNSSVLKNLLNSNPKTKAVIGHFMYGIHKELEKVDCKYVTFLRNPIARALSHYAHHYSSNLHLKDDLNNLMLENDDILSYLLNDSVKNQYNNLQVRYIGGYGDFDFSRASPQEIVKTCLSHIKSDFIFVGTQENFNADIVELSSLLKWENFGKDRIPYSNTRGRVNPGSIFTVDEINRLRYANELDFLLLKYYGQSADYERLLNTNALNLNDNYEVEEEYSEYKKLFFMSSLKSSAIQKILQHFFRLRDHSKKSQDIMKYQKRVLQNQQIEIEKLKTNFTNLSLAIAQRDKQIEQQAKEIDGLKSSFNNLLEDRKKAQQIMEYQDQKIRELTTIEVKTTNDSAEIEKLKN